MSGDGDGGEREEVDCFIGARDDEVDVVCDGVDEADEVCDDDGGRDDDDERDEERTLSLSENEREVSLL